MRILTPILSAFSAHSNRNKSDKGKKLDNLCRNSHGNNIIDMYNKTSSLQVKDNAHILLKAVSSSSKPLSLYSASTAADSDLAFACE